jgi:hypothetical protein
MRRAKNGRRVRMVGRVRRVGFERGSGLLPTVFGLAVLLGMLGLACNVALGLWNRTTTESIAYEAARSVATAEPGVDQEAVRDQALDRACHLLGSNCADVDLYFESAVADQPMVALHVSAPGVGLLPRFIANGGPVVGELNRTIRIRREGL